MRSGRIYVASDNGETIVDIGPSKSVVSVLMSSVICMIALVAASVASYGLVTGHAPLGAKVFFVLYIAAAIVFAAFAVLNVLSILYSRWRVSISAESISVAWRMPLLSRFRTFALSNVSDVRIQERKARGLRFHYIVFECNGKTQYATPSLQKVDLEMLMQGPFAKVKSVPNNSLEGDASKTTRASS